jgi:hypothetical protein
LSRASLLFVTRIRYYPFKFTRLRFTDIDALHMLLQVVYLACERRKMKDSVFWSKLSVQFTYTQLDNSPLAAHWRAKDIFVYRAIKRDAPLLAPIPAVAALPSIGAAPSSSIPMTSSSTSTSTRSESSETVTSTEVPPSR